MLYGACDDGKRVREQDDSIPIEQRSGEAVTGLTGNVSLRGRYKKTSLCHAFERLPECVGLKKEATY